MFKRNETVADTAFKVFERRYVETEPLLTTPRSANIENCPLNPYPSQITHRPCNYTFALTINE